MLVMNVNSRIVRKGGEGQINEERVRVEERTDAQSGAAIGVSERERERSACARV